MTKDTRSKHFFDAKYRLNPDFWNFASSPYELGRYDAMFHLLEPERYGRAFEPGCSIGVFTSRLASLCGRVEAIDISPLAVAQARARCKNLPNVNVTCGALPQAIPEGHFDLIVFSEIGYYFTPGQLATLCRDLIGRISPSGTLLATHWLGNSPDHLLTGDQVHGIIGHSEGLALNHSECHVGFRIDRWSKQ